VAGENGFNEFQYGVTSVALQLINDAIAIIHNN
jgi:hypothetical protein